jgi:hypothetical protein
MNQVSVQKVSDSLFTSLAIIGLAEELARHKESGSPVGKLSASRRRSRLRFERLSVSKVEIGIQPDQERSWNADGCYTSFHHSLDDNP